MLSLMLTFCGLQQTLLEILKSNDKNTWSLPLTDPDCEGVGRVLAFCVKENEEDPV